ncbi:heavy metal translocating P-type ATPase [Pseudomonas sp. BN505]|uniref:heavy metal translocating P-type ATPase n=1 Tax=Pseudomonas TaxID=286 RepID=UPI00075114EC|nr:MULTISPECIES: heavy metal translocating P-type ATPase [Pseudomonas]MDH4843625.1 heavy metal translocating P-type ATPase [Pseudomonas sp. BN605]MDH4857429.1 heavy metal translocating P-type ATPase [Pseudomonas sp. BN505]WQE51229.1 heavy metal translocating P-type ATPase [Pseudomonas putida]GLO02732.1 cation transporter [Pseudomonas putida]HDS1005108.1 heavy metal translocating P-type ATPase [Pseudomonas putida]
MPRRLLDPALLGICLLALLTGGVAYAAQRPAWAALAWATGGLVMAGVLAVEMLRRLARGEAGIDLIALLSIGAALALENMLVAAVVALMLATGRALEAFSVRHAERELRALIDRAPQRAWIQEQDGLCEVAVDQVRPGQAVLVRLGEIVPVDGRLQSPLATLDEAALTGESLPVTRHRGESVASGVCNVGAPLLLVATQTAAQSTYAGIVRLAETARQSRAPFVRLADRYALAFIPLTLLIAALAWWASGDPQRVLAVLVVATPCPLILAVPIAVLSGISRAARRSILVRDGAVLEALAGIRQVFLDKTGTLTSGHARLQSIELNGEGAPLQVLQWAASLAQASTHPIARAIVDAALARGLALTAPEQVQEAPGQGLAGQVQGKGVRLGLLAYVQQGRDAGHWAQACLQQLDYLASSGSFVAVDGELKAMLRLADDVRRETPQTLRRLRARGIDQIVMLTGDRPQTAQMIALTAGIDALRSGLSPQDKVRLVQEGRQKGPALMVGDGINDAPALAAADVGVAMGASGVTASAQSSGVVLLVDRLDRLIEALDIARHAVRIARQGVWVGMSLSLLAMLFAAAGYLPAVMGAVLQEGIDLLIILNALRALGPVAGDGRNGLPAVSLQRMQDEHRKLEGLLTELSQMARDFASRPAPQARADLGRLVAALHGLLERHERDDEQRLYPLLSRYMGGEDPLSPLSHTHREMFRLIHLLTRMSEDFTQAAANPSADEIQHQLIRLDTLAKLHFDQEEALYRYLDKH